MLNINVIWFAKDEVQQNEDALKKFMSTVIKNAGRMAKRVKHSGEEARFFFWTDLRHFPLAAKEKLEKKGIIVKDYREIKSPMAENKMEKAGEIYDILDKFVKKGYEEKDVSRLVVASDILRILLLDMHRSLTADGDVYLYYDVNDIEFFNFEKDIQALKEKLEQSPWGFKSTRLSDNSMVDNDIIVGIEGEKFKKLMEAIIPALYENITKNEGNYAQGNAKSVPNIAHLKNVFTIPKGLNHGASVSLRGTDLSISLDEWDVTKILHRSEDKREGLTWVSPDVKQKITERLTPWYLFTEASSSPWGRTLTDKRVAKKIGDGDLAGFFKKLIENTSKEYKYSYTFTENDRIEIMDKDQRPILSVNRDGKGCWNISATSIGAVKALLENFRDSDSEMPEKSKKEWFDKFKTIAPRVLSDMLQYQIIISTTDVEEPLDLEKACNIKTADFTQALKGYEFNWDKEDLRISKDGAPVCFIQSEPNNQNTWTGIGVQSWGLFKKFLKEMYATNELTDDIKSKVFDFFLESLDGATQCQFLPRPPSLIKKQRIWK